jgi:Fe-S oxidoreductase
LIRKGELKIKKEFNRKVVYHDPCYLGRQGDGIYDEPRNILKSIQGLEILEFEQNRDKSTCCGGGGLLRAFLPKLSVEVAKEKIELQTPQNVDGIVSCCPFCDINLKEGADEIKTKIKVYDLVNILEEAL